ncbi:hypothetical protein [Phaffia rhodozyma]|uniref:Uncharacterized protein n=1 Tax=Phaffia rhodozyma TaxID=264483 RepID=A0A0F7SGC0_PHARH|nr:hypothetical protein [Phaffia rhodozyma]
MSVLLSKPPCPPMSVVVLSYFFKTQTFLQRRSPQQNTYHRTTLFFFFVPGESALSSQHTDATEEQRHMSRQQSRLTLTEISGHVSHS